MSRRVEVDLILNARNYLDESKKVLAQTKAMEAALTGVGDEADLTSADLGGLTQTTSHTTETLGGLGSKSRDTGEALRLLDERIAKTKQSVRELGIEFAHTGDAATGKQLDSERSMLGRLTRLRKEVALAHDELQKLANLGDGDGKRGNLLTRLLGTVQDAFGAGVKIGGAVVSGFGDAFSAMGPHIKAIAIGALIAAGVAASPMMAAMIGGAVTLGVGTIGLAGGIFAATRDPAVQAAIMDFQGSISTMFFNSAGSFVDPLINALGILKTGFRDLDLKATFAIAAPYVEVVAKGIAGLGTEFMPRFRDALKAAGPALQAMAQQLPRLGAALGDMLKRMAESRGTVQGVMAIFGLLNRVLISIGTAVGWLSDRYYQMNQAVALTTGHLSNLIGRGNAVGDMFGWMHDTVQKYIDQSKNIPVVTNAAGDAFRAVVPPMRDTNAAMSELIGLADNVYRRTMDIARANLGLKQSFADLAQSYRDNGRTLDVNTQKGRDNWRATLDTVDAIKAKSDADVANGQTMGVANVIYQANIQKLIDQAKEAKASAEQIQTLTDKLNQVPKLTEAMIRLQFEQGGTSLGEHSGPRLKDLNPPKSRPVQYTGRGNRWGGAYTHAEDGALRQAGVYSARNPARYAFAEPATGGEAFVPRNGDAARSMGILQTAAGWYGAQVVPTGGWRSAGGMGGGAGMGGGGGRSVVDLNVTVTDTSGRTLRRELITDALNRNKASNVVAAAYP